MADTVRVAIIGTAGRDGDLTNDSFERMNSLAICAIQELGYTPKDVILVSGGAPWADHVAVSLFLDGKVAGLELKLPGRIVESKKCFSSQPLEGSTRPRDCRTLTSYHAKFTKKFEMPLLAGRERLQAFDSIGQIQEAIDNGATMAEFDGYFARNKEIATECDAMVALHTKRSHPSRQSRGGTSWTFMRASVPKLYIPINDVNCKSIDFDALGFSTFEAIGVQNVYKRFKNCFKGPMDAFLKRAREDETDGAPSAKRAKSL